MLQFAPLEQSNALHALHDNWLLLPGESTIAIHGSVLPPGSTFPRIDVGKNVAVTFWGRATGPAGLLSADLRAGFRQGCSVAPDRFDEQNLPSSASAPIWQRLWAPWRLAYITEKDALPERSEQADSELPRAATPESLVAASVPKQAGCFLCEYLAQPATCDRDNLILHRGSATVTVLNRYPYNNGHLLVAPCRHVAELAELSDEELLGSQKQLAAWTVVLQQTFRAQGFNVGLNLGAVAGAGLPGHLHWHLVPRWGGDTNFMPVLAGVHVLPQALEASYELLSRGWDAVLSQQNPPVGNRTRG